MMNNRKLSDTPKIIFVGFDDKPIDMGRTLTKKLDTMSPAEQQLANYFKALYKCGEASQ